MLYQALLTSAELRPSTVHELGWPRRRCRMARPSVQQAVPAGTPLRRWNSWACLPLMAAADQDMARANYAAATDAANAVLDQDQGLAIAAKRRVWETAAIGAAGLILTLIVTILLARSIIRRLTVLRRSALTLAEEQLPAVVARLRRGESVDVAAEAPPLRVGSDEIGQVGQAIDTVRQTAIRSAVEEARLRQGINDMFRNLARRNQSLLQRQLTTLDSMERKATDPDVLEDLFKMDHLTTRMRRHAEGLIILSGSPPGRSWSSPVRLIDVMRGAIAEVEDYARVTVATQSRAAVAGSAVTDVIHLLAELIENATSLSPPFTQVRVTGETVANGFAIEIEDRGLGMTPARMTELNERLSNPPDINPANTEQLGLFVVGQLARRHGISVTLRQSPYGGTTAVTLIPQRLIVEEGPAAITAGDSGDVPIGAGPVPGAPYAPIIMNGTPNGGGRGGMNGSYGSAGGHGGPYDGPSNGSYAGAYSGPATGPYGGGNGGAYGGNGGAYGGNGSLYPDPNVPRFTPAAPAAPGGSGAFAMPRSDLGYPPADQGGYGRPVTDAPGAPGTLPMRHGSPAQGSPAQGSPAQGGGAANGGASPDARRGRHGAPEVPVVTGVPVSRAAAPPADPFDVFTPLRRSEPDGAAPPGGPANAPYAGLSWLWRRPARSVLVSRRERRERWRQRRGLRRWRGREQRCGGLQGAAAPRASGQPRSAASLHRAGYRSAGIPPAATPSLSTCGTRCRPCSAAGSKAGHSRNRTRKAASMGTNHHYPANQLDWLLDDLVVRVPTSSERCSYPRTGWRSGASRGLDRADAEHLAALAAGFQSLARGAGRHFGGGEVRQTIIEMTSGFLFVTAAGQGTCLAVLTEAEADVGLVAYEMAVLVQRTGDHLQVNMRTHSALSGS